MLSTTFDLPCITSYYRIIISSQFLNSISFLHILNHNVQITLPYLTLSCCIIDTQCSIYYYAIITENHLLLQLIGITVIEVYQTPILLQNYIYSSHHFYYITFSDPITTPCNNPMHTST